MTPEQLSVIAIVVSVLAAGFTGWQAYVAHLTRRDTRSVHLYLDNRNDGYGRPTQWVLANHGQAAVLDIRLKVTYSAPGNAHPDRTWEARCAELSGGGEADIEFNRSLPPFGTTIADRDYEFWNVATAVAIFTRAGSRKASSTSVGLMRPPAPSAGSDPES
jgi:hypothetical protein